MERKQYKINILELINAYKIGKFNEEITQRFHFLLRKTWYRYNTPQQLHYNSVNFQSLHYCILRKIYFQLYK